VATDCVITQVLGWMDWSKWLHELNKALILYQTVRIPYHEITVKSIIEKDKTVSKSELMNCLKPREDVLPEFEFAYKQAIQDLKDNDLFAICEQVIRLMKKPEPNHENMDEWGPWYHDFVKDIWGLLTFANTDLLVAHRHQAAIFPSELDISIVSYKLGRKLDIPKRHVFTEIINLTVPNFSELSLHNILDLRQDTLIQQFREKISMLSQSVVSESYKSPEEPCEIVKEIAKAAFLDDIFELVGRVKPDIKKTLAKAVITKIPIPPLNYIIDAAVLTDNLIKQWKLKKSHGWIFFISEMRKPNI